MAELKMRVPRYLSPSALFKFESDRTTFFEQYLSPVRTSRPPQQDFMAMGSALDARVKSEIHKAVHGEHVTKGTKYNFETLFESQVEPHIRDVVLERSTDLWDQYVKSGAYGALLSEIVQSPFEPEMEFTAKGDVEGVPLLGKPDLRYITKSGLHVISDWKVNGSMSKFGASPVQGYKVCYDSYGSSTNGKPFRARRLKTDPPDKVYKDYKPMEFRGSEINEWYLEDYSTDWATQLAIYSWLLGEPIGREDYIIRMEQIACRPVKSQPLPRAKFATHVSRISKDFQEQVLARVKMCWATIMSGHIFTDVSRERSDEICGQLVAKAKMPPGLYPSLTRKADTSLRFK
jgi:hypothetical protein